MGSGQGDKRGDNDGSKLFISTIICYCTISEMMHHLHPN